MPDFSPYKLLRELTPLSRTLVHDDNKVALDIIKQHLPAMEIEAYPSNKEVWTWRVPNKWKLLESRIEDNESGELLCYLFTRVDQCQGENSCISCLKKQSLGEFMENKEYGENILHSIGEGWHIHCLP